MILYVALLEHLTRTISSRELYFTAPGWLSTSLALLSQPAVQVLFYPWTRPASGPSARTSGFLPLHLCILRLCVGVSPGYFLSRVLSWAPSPFMQRRRCPPPVPPAHPCSCVFSAHDGTGQKARVRSAARQPALLRPPHPAAPPGSGQAYFVLKLPLLPASIISCLHNSPVADFPAANLDLFQNILHIAVGAERSFGGKKCGCDQACRSSQSRWWLSSPSGGGSALPLPRAGQRSLSCIRPCCPPYAILPLLKLTVPSFLSPGFRSAHFHSPGRVAASALWSLQSPRKCLSVPHPVSSSPQHPVLLSIVFPADCGF